MSKEELPIYLNDHLAGSVGALELLDRLIETYKGGLVKNIHGRAPGPEVCRACDIAIF